VFQRPDPIKPISAKVVSAYWRFGWPIVSLVVIMGFAGLMLLLDFSRAQDRAFIKNSRELVQQGIDGVIENNAVYSEEYAHWDDAYKAITFKDDQAWLGSNFKPINSAALGVYRQGTGMRYLYLRQDAQTAKQDIISYVTSLSLLEHRPYQLSRDHDQIVVAPSGLMVFDGRLAAIAIQPIRPERDSSLPKPAPETPVDYSVFVTFIDAAKATKIGRASGLQMPELHVSDVAQPLREGRVGLDLFNPSGALIARIDWVDERPGSAAFTSRFLPIAVILIIVGTLTLVVTYNLASRQTQLAEAARRAAEEASHQKSSFIANVSHELRTPLNAIIGYSEILIEDALDADNQTSAADATKVTRAAKHLLSLINDLLDHSKIEAGKMDLNPERTKIAPILEDVVEAVALRAKEQGNGIEIACDPLMGEAHLDGMRLKQCLLNLASNAVKFTQNGKVTLYARPLEVDGTPYLRFVVKDTGSGMSPAMMEKLFMPFVQADEVTSMKYGGTGLGLVITRRLIEAMGGQVSVESVEGEGSSFTLLVPRGMAWLSEYLPSASEAA
jgi:signal transduction histidine kinase